MEIHVEPKFPNFYQKNKSFEVLYLCEFQADFYKTSNYYYTIQYEKSIYEVSFNETNK